MVDITADPTFELPPTQVPEEVPAEPTAEPVVDIVATPVFELPPTEPADLPDPVVETVVEVEVAEVVEALAEADLQCWSMKMMKLSRWHQKKRQRCLLQPTHVSQHSRRSKN